MSRRRITTAYIVLSELEIACHSSNKDNVKIITYHHYHSQFNLHNSTCVTKHMRQKTYETKKCPVFLIYLRLYYKTSIALRSNIAFIDLYVSATQYTKYLVSLVMVKNCLPLFLTIFQVHGVGNVSNQPLYASVL